MQRFQLGSIAAFFVMTVSSLIVSTTDSTANASALNSFPSNPHPISSRVKIANRQQQRLPGSSGSCRDEHGWIENCFENVEWQVIPNSYSDFTGDHSYIGINTLVRNGDSINFDFHHEVYVRYSANCRTGMMAIIRATDSHVDPDRYTPATNVLRSRALRYACSR